ncbi:MAG: hypothetical protein IT285_06750 [Bdellovibrionales bacterium]|nr:hypothetical protein [Bdellovibrionales bacterium]
MNSKSFLFLAMLLLPRSAAAVTYEDLTPAEKNRVQAGEVVAVTQDVEGKPWPKVWVFIRIGSTPEEAASVWSDFDLQKSYVPKLLESKIVRRIDAATCHVSYKLDLPWPIADESYTVEDRVSREGEAYLVSWMLVRADTTKQSDGFTRFESLGTGTLLTYFNFVVPGQGLAGIVDGQAEKQVKEVARALRTQVEMERSTQPELLASQISRLRIALGQ